MGRVTYSSCTSILLLSYTYYFSADFFRTSIPENRDSIDLMASMGFQSKEAVPTKEQFEEAKFGVRIKALNKVF